MQMKCMISENELQWSVLRDLENHHLHCPSTTWLASPLRYAKDDAPKTSVAVAPALPMEQDRPGPGGEFACEGLMKIEDAFDMDGPMTVERIVNRERDSDSSTAYTHSHSEQIVKHCHSIDAHTLYRYSQQYTEHHSNTTFCSLGGFLLMMLLCCR